MLINVSALVGSVHRRLIQEQYSHTEQTIANEWFSDVSTHIVVYLFTVSRYV